MRNWIVYLVGYAAYLIVTIPGLAMAEDQADVNLRPNIVLIMADDLGWKDLHCYGNPHVDTPAIDRLAASGMRFTDAYSASPVCTPTRAALMTGRSPARLQITNHAGGHPSGFRLPGTDLESAKWTRHLSLEETTLAEHLKTVGYATGFFGKWHLSHRPKGSGAPEEASLRPQHQGFDVNVGGCDFGGPPSYFAPFKNPAMNNEGDPYLPDRLAYECLAFIRDHIDQPFFVCWWNYSVHYPFQAPETLVKKYENRKRETEPDIKNPTYTAMIEGMDHSIGKLITGIGDLGLDDRTLVIFTSDNGGHGRITSHQPLRGNKGNFYEGGIRVPLIVKWPGVIKPDSTCTVPVISTDYYPTLLAMTGQPARPKQHMDGRNLLPLLKQTGTVKRVALYWHYPNYIGAGHPGGARPCSVIRSGDWKLIESFETNRLELFNLKEDLGEQNDLAAKMPAKAKALQQQLAAWRAEAKVQMPQRNPNYKVGE